MIGLATLSIASANAQIKVFVDNDQVMFADSGPRMVGERVMVPLRGVFEEMGADVDWNAARQEVTARHGEKTIVLWVGNREARVDGMSISMDRAPMKWRDRVYVPLRFLSESMGAAVRWESQVEAVYIETEGNVSTSPGSNNVGNAYTLMLPQDTILPLRLSEELNSKTAKKGDQFTAVLDTKDNADYAGLPKGTKLMGEVIGVTKKANDTPGMLDLEFNKIILPDGKTQNISASLVDLSSKDITTTNGVMTANTSKKKDDLKYVGYGAGAGVLLAAITKSNVIQTGLLGGAIGYLFGLTQKDSDKFNDVVLKKDAELGVQLDRELNIKK